MKVSLNLAQTYSNADIRSAGAEKILLQIGAQLGAVEEVTDWGSRYENIVVAKIVSCIQHPNADKLRVCTIDDGGVTKNVKRDGNGYVEVVCGAPNAREGLTVAWLPPGSTVPSSFEKDPFVLEARELRGVVSNGMLASPKELAISEDHEGILEIDTDKELMKPGTPFKKLYDLDDIIIDCENKMFTHRPDCFGNLGVARELAGIQGQKFRSPEWYNLEPVVELHSSDEIKDIKIEVELPELVPRYMLVAIENVKIGPSPIWLQSYLSRLGIRPINNIVDMTNYLMMVTGQPLHAFDFDKISKEGSAHVIVRNPKKGETLTLLNGKTITPRDEAILICDEDKPIALGGVMGGANSEIDNNTSRILIESATFDMYNIRRTSMEHGLFTDAVTRFTKGQSPWQCPAVIAKAVEMIGELSPGAKAVGKPMDIDHIKNENQDIAVTADFINERLGSKLSMKEIAELLENVEFKIANVPADKNRLHITAPFWRMDIEQPEDIVEEIGRLYGYDKLPVELPARSTRAAALDPELSLKKEIRGILASAGANEVLTYSFVHGDLLKKVGQNSEEAFALRNALSPDLQYYRLSLSPSLLDKVHMNIRAGSGDETNEFAIFEIGKSHKKGIQDKNEQDVPNEEPVISLVFAADEKTSKKYEGAPYFAAKKYLSFLLTRLGVNFTIEPFKDEPLKLGQQTSKVFEPSRSAIVTVNNELIGFVGEYNNNVRTSLKLPAYCAGFEIAIDNLGKRAKTAYTSLSVFPKTQQDITFETSDKTNYAQIVSVLEGELNNESAEHGYKVSLMPKNIYHPSEQKVRYTFRITLSHPERTLVTTEVNALLDNVAAKLNEKLSVERI